MLSTDTQSHTPSVPTIDPDTTEPDVIHDILLACDDDTFITNLVTYVTTDNLGRQDVALTDVRVLDRLYGLDDTRFLQAILALAAPERAGLELLFTDAVMARIAALPYAKYHGVFLPGAKHVPNFDVHHYRRELRPYLLRHSAQQGCHQTFAPMTGAALLAKQIPDLEFVVEDILPVGATLFVGRAKDGKSLAMWNLCLGVASGGIVFGRYSVTQGPVLYLALEDGERRAQKRLRDQLRAMNLDTCPDGFEVHCWDAPRVGEGLEERLHEWLDAHPGAKLVVIDILEKIRPPRTRNGSVYADDYAAVAPLQRLAQDRGIALVLVHHTHKAKVDDFRDAPSGSISLLGAVDTLWSLRRVAGEQDAILQITGRDLLETPELAMQFRDGFWTAKGDAATTVLNPAHQAILETLRTAGYPMTPTQLSKVLEVNLNTMKVHLMRLTERGLVAKTGDGQYMHCIMTPTVPVSETPVTHETHPPVQEEAPPPPVPAVEEVEARITPLMDAAAGMDDVPAAEGDRVTAVTPDVPQSPPAATNGHSNGHRAAVPAYDPPPQFCPGCGAETCWLDRGMYYQCSHRPCGRKVIKALS